MRIVATMCAAGALLFAAGPEPMRNGAYLVLREAPDRESAAVAGRTHRVLRYEAQYSEADRGRPPRFLALETSSFVPLILAAPPESRKDERGWTALSVTLAREHVKTLEEFSRAHLDEQVAIVLGGEIVTIHKVRSVIPDGRFQLTRCLDNACEVLKGRLAEK